jgi:hypothetical protein
VVIPHTTLSINFSINTKINYTCIYKSILLLLSFKNDKIMKVKKIQASTTLEPHIYEMLHKDIYNKRSNECSVLRDIITAYYTQPEATKTREVPKSVSKQIPVSSGQSVDLSTLPKSFTTAQFADIYLRAGKSRRGAEGRLTRLLKEKKIMRAAKGTYNKIQ